jgi:hypothetical protein
MFYSLLGRVVWFGARWYLRRRFGRIYVPKPLLAGGIVALILGVALLGKYQT